MEELAVKISICDRVYPMKVQSMDEKYVRTAGNLIKKRIKVYSDQFGIHDKQDLLAMVALDCFIDMLKQKDKTTQATHVALEQINVLGQQVEQALTSARQPATVNPIPNCPATTQSA